MHLKGPPIKSYFVASWSQKLSHSFMYINQTSIIVWGSLSKQLRSRVMHRVEKEGGHLLEKKYFKSQLSLLHNSPPPSELHQYGIVEHREATYHLGGSESWRARMPPVFMLFKQNKRSKRGLMHTCKCVRIGWVTLRIGTFKWHNQLVAVQNAQRSQSQMFED